MDTELFLGRAGCLERYGGSQQCVCVCVCVLGGTSKELWESRAQHEVIATGKESRGR